MAFCNSCGAVLPESTKFCNKCGAAVTGAPVAAAPPPSAPAPSPSSGSSSALKIILIVVGVIVLIGVLGVASITFFAYRIARHSSQRSERVKVETPFGTVESSKDPEQAAKDLGVDIYPGAEVQRNGSSSATFGNIKTVTAMFESNDPVDKVCSFYKEKFPGANVTTSDQDRCSLVASMPPNMVTINIEQRGGGSKFQITTVNKESTSDQ